MQALLLALVLAAAADDLKAVLAELAKLDGNWHAVAVEEDGKTRKIENGAKLAIKGSRCTITKRNGKKFDVLLDIGDLKAKALDLRDTEGRLAFRCLYQIDGDAFPLAIGADERPKDMTSSKTVSVATYRRMKSGQAVRRISAEGEVIDHFPRYQPVTPPLSGDRYACTESLQSRRTYHEPSRNLSRPGELFRQHRPVADGEHRASSGA